MALTGSQPWKTPARLGVARLGATRLGGYRLNLSIVIDGVDVTDDIQMITLDQAINDEADTGQLVTLPSPSFTPSNGLTVVIGFGGIYREFGGQIANVATELLGGVDPIYTITLKDWQRLFDCRLVCRIWSGVSATTIVREIIADYTTGFFDAGVEADLPVIESLTIINKYPSEALKQVIGLLGGGYVVSEARTVMLWGAGGSAAVVRRTAPRPIVVGLSTLQTLQHTAASDQLRTRVYVEGNTTRCPIPILRDGFPSRVYTDFGPNTYEIPVEDLTGIIDPTLIPGNPPSPPNMDTPGGTVRIGPYRVPFWTYNPAWLYPLIGNTAQVTADVAAGATYIPIVLPAQNTTYDSWAKVGDQYIYFGDYDSDAERLIDIPASGQGAIQVPIAKGTQLTFLPTLTLGLRTGFYPLHDQVEFPGDLAAGMEVVAYAQTDDEVAQAILAAREGGDGIHEVVVPESNSDPSACRARALEEIANYSRDLQSLTWTTRDMHARPGAAQDITLPAIGVSLTLTITKASLSFDVTKRREPPFRRCEASIVQTPRLLDTVAKGHS